jgi:uncharacterized protein YjbI with pentapeptide repeats
MANEEHVALLKKGVKVWNKWRQANPKITPDLSESVLATLFLIEFDVDKGHVIGINLQEANLSRANLTLADLTSANLSRANLNSANLQRADITLANLTLVDLSDSELIETRALGTNFNLARLTGACLENWHIDGDTKLDDVLCDYVYLRYFQKERCPSHDKFAPGEFTKRFQFTQNVIELAFRDGVP